MFYLNDDVDVSTFEIGVKGEIFITLLAFRVHASELELIREVGERTCGRVILPSFSKKLCQKFIILEFSGVIKLRVFERISVERLP